MNPYTTRTRARIQPHDLANAVFTDAFIAAPALTVLEWHRGWQAEAEVDGLLKHNGVPLASAASRIATVRQAIGAARQAIGAALVRAGQRLGGATRREVSLETAPVAGTFGTAG